MPTVSRDQPTASGVKCACRSCNCMVHAGQEIERDGKLYCSRACAYDCTETTCLCVHERCEVEH